MYSPAEKAAAADLLAATKRLPATYPACKVAEAGRAYAMAVITDAPYSEVAQRDQCFMDSFNVR